MKVLKFASNLPAVQPTMIYFKTFRIVKHTNFGGCVAKGTLFSEKNFNKRKYPSI
jgi:hypothetical protein